MQAWNPAGTCRQVQLTFLRRDIWYNVWQLLDLSKKWMLEKWVDRRASFSKSKKHLPESPRRPLRSAEVPGEIAARTGFHLTPHHLSPAVRPSVFPEECHINVPGSAFETRHTHDQVFRTKILAPCGRAGGNRLEERGQHMLGSSNPVAAHISSWTSAWATGGHPKRKASTCGFQKKILLTRECQKYSHWQNASDSLVVFIYSVSSIVHALGLSTSKISAPKVRPHRNDPTPIANAPLFGWPSLLPTLLTLKLACLVPL